jgi:hypothetical protein
MAVSFDWIRSRILVQIALDKLAGRHRIANRDQWPLAGDRANQPGRALLPFAQAVKPMSRIDNGLDLAIPKRCRNGSYFLALTPGGLLAEGEDSTQIRHL